MRIIRPDSEHMQISFFVFSLVFPPHCQFIHPAPLTPMPSNNEQAENNELYFDVSNSTHFFKRYWHQIDMK